MANLAIPSLASAHAAATRRMTKPSDLYAEATHGPIGPTQPFQWPATIGFHRHQTPTKETTVMVTMPAQSIKRTIRRYELRQIVPLADTTIYEMEQRGEFPRRFALTTRCVVWDLAEVEAWLTERRRATESAETRRAPHPDVRKRLSRPVKARGQAPAAASTAE